MARAKPDHEDVTELLEAAARTSREGVWHEAAASLVAAWRRAPSARIARVFALVDKNLPSPPPIEGKTVGGRELRWQELARSFDETVLPTILADPWPTHPRQANARAEALAAWPRSPRISTALFALFARGQYRSQPGRVVTRRLFALLIGWGDPAVTEYLLKLETDTSSAAESERLHLRSILKRRRTVEPTWAPREDAALGVIEALLAPAQAVHTHSREQLLAGVYDAPLDDGPRLVLADFLIERGDSRGELIALQIQRYRDPTRRGGAAQEQALLRRGGRSWFDGLDRDGASHISIDRGFPIAATAMRFDFTSPAWATIESLILLHQDAPFRGAPMLRGLRRLFNVRATQLRSITLVRELDALWLADPFASLDEHTEVAPRQFGIAYKSVTDWPRRVRELVSRLRGTAVGRQITSVQLGNYASELPLAFELFALAPWLEEVTLDVRPDEYADITPSRWTGHSTRAKLALRWHGSYAIQQFHEIIDLIRKVPPGCVPLEVVEIAGTRGVEPDMVVRVRDLLLRVFEAWPTVRELRLFGTTTRR